MAAGGCKWHAGLSRASRTHNTRTTHNTAYDTPRADAQHRTCNAVSLFSHLGVVEVVVFRVRLVGFREPFVVRVERHDHHVLHRARRRGEGAGAGAERRRGGAAARAEGSGGDAVV